MRGGVHVGDLIIQQPSAQQPLPSLPAASSNGSTLGKLAIAAALAMGGAGAGLGTWQALQPEEPPAAVVEQGDAQIDKDTIGVLEPDR